MLRCARKDDFLAIQIDRWGNLLFANRVRYRLFTDITDFRFILFKADKNPALAQRNITAMRFDVRRALTRNIVYSRRHLFEDRCGLVKRVLATPRDLVFMRGHAMQQPPIPRCNLAAIGSEFSFARFDQVLDQRFLRHRVCADQKSGSTSQ